VGHISSRQRKVLVAYLDRRIIEMPDGSFVVQGRRKKRGGREPSYALHVDPETNGLVCTCEGYREQFSCKHVGAVEKFQKEGEPKVGYDHLDDSKRATYPQDGPRYRMARRVLLAALPLAVRALADSVFPIVEEPRRPRGRPRIPDRDLIVCVALRTIHRRGGDLVQAIVDDFHHRRLLYRRPMLYVAPPATSSITKNMRSDRLAAAIRKLIQESNVAYRGKPTRIAIDGSEFSCPTLTQRKDGKTIPLLVDVKTVKLHAAVDIDDGYVVDCWVTPGKGGEAEQALALLEAIRNVRFVTAFVADKGYVAEYLIEFCERHGIDVAIPTKSNTSHEGESVLARYARAWDKRDDAKKDLYARRGIVESAFSRLKRFADEDLRGRTLGAQRVELLSHVLVANVAHHLERYVYGEIDLPWLDDRTRKILDPARDVVRDLPKGDRNPRYRDGLPDDAVTAEDVA